jgi:hypothetical protein
VQKHVQNDEEFHENDVHSVDVHGVNEYVEREDLDKVGEKDWAKPMDGAHIFQELIISQLH